MVTYASKAAFDHTYSFQQHMNAVKSSHLLWFSYYIVQDQSSDTLQIYYLLMDDKSHLCQDVMIRRCSLWSFTTT